MNRLNATDRFYRQGGLDYHLGKVVRWLSGNIALPASGRMLDVCCGDGIWSQGIRELNPNLDVYGIDISEGAVSVARGRLGVGPERFVLGDAELPLPWPDGRFELVFARGAGIFNQHDMTLATHVIEDWHRVLAPTGRLWAIYGSKPELAGAYTPPADTRLPLNHTPRVTGAVDFRGGKFHHSTQSFAAAFEAAKGVAVVDHRFDRNRHVLVTRRT